MELRSCDRQTAFERYLFTQDVGRPAVHEGLLYWPHEDMRIGLGSGVASVTNGVSWRDLHVPSEDHMMHTHAMTPWRGGLVAAMAGWNSVLATSRDAGRSWQALVNDPPKSGSFHRYNDVAAQGDRLFVRHWQDTGLSLAEFKNGRVSPVPGWPQNRHFSSLTPFGGCVYALVDDEQGRAELWRIGEGAPERVDTVPRNLDVTLLFSDGASLWLVARDTDGGQLWSSPDGETFTAGDTVRGGVVLSGAALSPGKVYVGGAGFDGLAILWGPQGHSHIDIAAPAALPDRATGSRADFDEDAERLGLLAAFFDPQNYQRHGRPLRRLLAEIAAGNPPPEFLASLLDARMPDRDIEVFGGQFSVEARAIGTWHILAAMAKSGNATVPAHLLETPWLRQPNGPQKWFDSLPIAMHAVLLSGQDTRATVDALIGRLDNSDDPDWLTSQVTGTLSAITGEAFAFDKAGWKDWWATASRTWPANGTH